MNIKNNNEELAAKAAEALKFVDDPEIGLNVVDLGLIYELDFYEPDRRASCTMTLTTEFCPMGDSIRANVLDALQSALPGFAVEVHLTFDPPWSQAMITEEGRQFLGG